MQSNGGGQSVALIVLYCVGVLHLGAFVGVTVYYELRIRLLEQNGRNIVDVISNDGARLRRNIRANDETEMDHTLSNFVREIIQFLKADDTERARKIRQSTSGNEMAQIFEQLANSELAIFNKYCGQNSTICLPGPKGEKGDPGLAGTAGIKGDSGTAGEKGSKGDVGLPGLKGLKGEPGMLGFPGVKGDKGEDGLPGLSGPAGIKGDKGDKGDLGSEGPPGKDGAPGPPGVKGEKGRVGDPGMLGQKGDRGDFGPPGIPGAKGAAGFPGLKGDKGDSGTPGTPGPPGVRGEKGDPGVNGSSGPQGQKGEPGTKGDRGEAVTVQPAHPVSSCCDSLERPYFNQTTEEIHALEGTTITLHCNAHGHPKPKVEWILSSKNGSSKVIPFSNQETITLPNLDPDANSGTYMCTASSALGQASKTVQLNVYEHIRIVDHISNHTLLVGQNVVFECKFGGEPKPTVTWYHVNKDGTRTKITDGVIEIPEGSQLGIPSVGIGDRGEYVCEATNGVETISEHAYLLTQGPPSITPPTPVTGLVGHNITLHCDVHGEPKPITTWVAPPNVNNAYEDKKGDLVLLNLQTGDAGSYICRATNSFGTVNSVVSLVVHGPGKVEIAGNHMFPVKPSTTSFAIDCKASGEAPLNVQWYHDGKPVVPNPTHVVLPDHTLLVLSVNRPADYGRYMCVASNIYGSDNATAFVYEDKGMVTCDVPFTPCPGKLCGATCPSGCQLRIVDGTASYPASEPLCSSAIQSGAIQSNGGVVTWQTAGNVATIQMG